MEIPASPAIVGGPAPRRAGPGPPRGPQCLEPAARLELGLAELAPDLARLAAGTLASLGRVEEGLDGLLDPEPDADALRFLEHPRVDRVLGPDR